MGCERYDWLSGLCRRLHHILQVRLSRRIEYDLRLAEEATRNSVAMLEHGCAGHFTDLGEVGPYGKDEVTTQTTAFFDDEGAMQRVADSWTEHDGPDFKHRDALARRTRIGIGFAFSDKDSIPVLYCTARLE